MTQETENPGKSADYPKYNSSIFKISFSEMVRYMTAHFAETTCPQCLKDEGWSMDMEGDNPEAEGYDIMRVYRLVHADNGKIFKPLIIMSCNACGSIRTMMADRVTDWLKANQEEKK